MQIPGLVDPQTTPRKPAPPRADGKRALLGLSKAQLRAALIAAGIPEKQAKMRGQQVWNWIYQRGATEISAFANISKDTRELLDAHFVVGRPEVVTAQVSTDGTRKWLLRFDDGEEAECVFIPDAYRGTLCVSSQVGCTLNCRFCFTGTMKLVRNLTPAEIVGQVMLARDALGEWPNGTASLPALPDSDDDDEDGNDSDGPAWIPGQNQPGSNYTSEGRMLTNIVMMGMGEPLYNFDNVRDALAIVMDGEGLGLSKRRITPSTLLSRCTPSPRKSATRSCRSTRNTASRNCCRPALPIPAPTMPGASPSNMSCSRTRTTATRMPASSSG